MSAKQESTSTEDIPLTQQIVESVAASKSTSPLELTPIYTVVDPEALEDLFSGPTQQGRIEFEYEGCHVRVDDDGDVTVTN